MTPDPVSYLDYNSDFAKTAEELAAAEGEKIGSLEWSRHGDFTQPWMTGGHPSEGWNRSHLFSHDATVERALRLSLSNLHARPHAYVFAPKRQVGYQVGERPSNWVWSPNVVRDQMDGGLLVGGVPVYGADSEHFLYEPAFSALECSKTFPLNAICTWGGAPLQMDTRSWLRTGVALVQWSCVGEIRAWAANQSGGLPVRAPDRVTHRLAYALMRTAQLVGLDGQDSLDAQAWIEAQYAMALANGPSVQTSKMVVTIPQVSFPYFNPTQSYGYGIPTWYWIDKLNKNTFHHELILKWCEALLNVVGDDGSVPWAVDSHGTLGYFGPQNGDRYTPGFENYAALRVAEALGFSAATVKAQAILARWKAMPEGEQKELQRGWFVNADRTPAW